MKNPWIFVALLLGANGALASSNVTYNYQRFDGHYKLIKGEGLTSYWKFDCPPPVVVSSSPGMVEMTAYGRCHASERVDTPLNCSPDLYVKGELARENNFYPTQIRFGESPNTLSGETAIIDENVRSNTCKDNRYRTLECVFARVILEYFSWESVSKKDRVSFEKESNRVESWSRSLEKRNGKLILKIHDVRAGTDGTGKSVKDGETKQECIYNAVAD
jgi:hypothetical protein